MDPESSSLGAAGDNGSNTPYRLFVNDLARGFAALDVITSNNFYAATFAAEGRRYDAVVAANPGASQRISQPAGFVVQGISAGAPTMVSPAHLSTVKQGNVQLGCSRAREPFLEIDDAQLYQYSVAVRGRSEPPASRWAAWCESRWRP